MKLILKVLLINLIAIQVNAQSNGNVKNIRKALQSIAAEYSPTAHIVFTKVGNYKYQKYIYHKTKSVVLNYYNVPVHESTHHYNDLIRKRKSPKEFIEKNTGAGYFIYPNIEIGMANFPVYNSIELNDVIPDSIQVKLDNYETYIGGNDIKNLSSQINGIFGLMDEFTAYSTGAKSQLELYNYYLANSKTGFENIEWWGSFINNLAGCISDYYEFKLFIHWYLAHSKNAHFEEYEKIMANKKLRLVFTLADQNYNQVIKAYYEKVAFICEATQKYANSLRFDYYENQTYKSLMTYKGLSISSVSYVFEEEMEFSRKLYELLDQSILNDFRIEGATKENYRNYLE